MNTVMNNTITLVEEGTISDCEHHWIIDQPNGPTSTGTCKACGAKSEFRNSIPGSGWDRDSTQKKRSKNAKPQSK